MKVGLKEHKVEDNQEVYKKLKKNKKVPLQVKLRRCG